MTIYGYGINTNGEKYTAEGVKKLLELAPMTKKFVNAEFTDLDELTDENICIFDDYEDEIYEKGIGALIEEVLCEMFADRELPFECHWGNVILLPTFSWQSNAQYTRDEIDGAFNKVCDAVFGKRLYIDYTEVEIDYC